MGNSKLPLLMLISLALSGCASTSNHAHGKLNFSFDRMASVDLGFSKERALKSLGQPSSQSSQVIGGAKYDDLSFYQNGRPAGFLLVDASSNLVAAKASYVDEWQMEQPLVEAQRKFPDAKFMELSTCDKHWNSIYQVDESKGLFIGVTRASVDTVMWADSKLTAKLISELKEKCSKENK